MTLFNVRSIFIAVSHNLNSCVKFSIYLVLFTNAHSFDRLFSSLFTFFTYFSKCEKTKFPTLPLMGEEFVWRDDNYAWIICYISFTVSSALPSQSIEEVETRPLQASHFYFEYLLSFVKKSFGAHEAHTYRLRNILERRCRFRFTTSHNSPSPSTSTLGFFFCFK